MYNAKLKPIATPSNVSLINVTNGKKVIDIIDTEISGYDTTDKALINTNADINVTNATFSGNKSIEDLQNKYNEEINKLKEQLNSKNDDLSNLEEIKEKMNQMEKEKTDLNNKLSKITNDNEVNQKEINDLKIQIDT